MKNLFFTLLLGLSFTLANGQDIEVPQVQRAMIIKHTATWCSNCGATAWDVFEKVVTELGDNSIPIAAHRSRSSDLYSSASSDLLGNFRGVVYQPEFFVNETKVTGSSSTLYDNIKNTVFGIESQTPDAQTGLELYIPQDSTVRTLTIKTRTKFYKELSGQYFMSLWFLEKEVVNFQQRRADDAVHKQVLRKSLLAETFGDELFNGNVSPAEDIYMDFTYNLEEGETLEGKEVMVSLWRLVEGRYEYVNSNMSDVFFIDVPEEEEEEKEEEEEEEPSNLLPILVGRFDVIPYTRSGQNTVILNLNENVENATLSLFNMNGQQVQHLFRGNLSEGHHQFDWSKNTNTGSGSFILTLQSPKGIMSRKLFLE